MLKGYKDRSFIGGTGPFFGNLRLRAKGTRGQFDLQNHRDQRCVTLQNIMHEKSPKSYEIESDDEYLSQDEKEIQKIK